ncbi:hypothetical protein RB195_008751 [Necator americanus]|uniref:SXP/RAL-2 family protein Ani s 5-like cation-binding domain-containing protein n=1 Tax=Necator americanus TaxID=51031 RepID=A0ABR1CQ62_NECAM
MSCRSETPPIMETFQAKLNSLARSIFAPFQSNSGGTSPFGLLRLPTLTELFSLPFIGKMSRQGLQHPEQKLEENLPLNRLMTFKPFRPEDLPTLPTFPPLLLPDFLRMAEPTPAASNRDRCVSKLSKEFRENEMYYDYVQEQVDEANITAAYDLVLAKAIEICSPEQVERLESFMKKYETLQKNIEELAPEYPKETRDQVLQWLREENYLAINGFISRESMANLFNAAKNSKLMQISFQLTSMQIDLFFNPI